MTLLQDNPLLLLSFRRGERVALERVYRHFVRDVVLLLQSGFVTSDGSRVPGLVQSADLLDTLQEVFARAFVERARLSYDGLRPYRPFLLQIAKNLRIDQLRASRWHGPLGRPNQEGEEEHSLEVAAPESAELSSESSQAQREWQTLAQATREYVQGLNETAQRFVALRFEEAKSQAEVAEIMHTTRRQVRSLQEQVQADLKRFLKGRGLI